MTSPTTTLIAELQRKRDEHRRLAEIAEEEVR